MQNDIINSIILLFKSINDLEQKQNKNNKTSGVKNPNTLNNYSPYIKISSKQNSSENS